MFYKREAILQENGMSAFSEEDVSISEKVKQIRNSEFIIEEADALDLSNRSEEELDEFIDRFLAIEYPPEHKFNGKKK
jgi:hypothetical protein